MTTTELIKLLQSVENGTDGTSREIIIYKKDKECGLESIISKDKKLEILSTCDGYWGSILSLIIND
jgi:hypothetical protein